MPILREDKITEYYKAYNRKPWKSFEDAYGIEFNIFQKVYLFCLNYLIRKKII
jgi:hypothetical protein